MIEDQQPPSSPTPSPGFFPNLLSVVVFAFIMIGMFFGFTRLYPLLVQDLFDRNRDDTPIVQQDPSLELAPFVRGILAGVETASEVMTPSNDALDISKVKGFQHGVKTSLIASQNWYDLDRQLFRVAGMPLGVKASVEISKSGTNRYSSAFQLDLIQRLQTAVSVNIDELLSLNSDSREATLQDYLRNLKKLRELASEEGKQLQNLITEADTDIAESREIANSFEGGPNTAQIEQYLQAVDRFERARINKTRYQEILNQIIPPFQQVERRISAIEANFEALSKGVKVNPTDGGQVPIFQDG